MIINDIIWCQISLYELINPIWTILLLTGFVSIILSRF